MVCVCVVCLCVWCVCVCVSVFVSVSVFVFVSVSVCVFVCAARVWPWADLQGSVVELRQGSHGSRVAFRSQPDRLRLWASHCPTPAFGVVCSSVSASVRCHSECVGCVRF